MIEKVKEDCVNIPTIRNKLNEVIDYLNNGTQRTFLVLFPCGYLSEENTYRLRLIVPGVDKFESDNDSAVWLETDIEAEDDERAILVAQRVAGALMTPLDLELLGR